MVFWLFADVCLVCWLDCCLASLLAVVLAVVLELAVVLDCWIVVYICLDEGHTHVCGDNGYTTTIYHDQKSPITG